MTPLHKEILDLLVRVALLVAVAIASVWIATEGGAG